MNDADQLDHPDRIPGYSYHHAERSPIGLDDLDRLVSAVGLTDDDRRHLDAAGGILAPRAAEMVDAWRELIGQHDHLAVYSQHPDGTPDREYSAASHPRFARWIIDACTRPFDQDWLDQQHEIGLRHTPHRKNQTDGSDSPDHIPLRYLLAFTAQVIATTRPFLDDGHHSAAEVDAMQAAWTKSVLLHVTVWSRAYADDIDW